MFLPTCRGFLLCKSQALKTVHKISDINNNFPYSMMDYVWENTVSTTPLRRYSLGQIIWESALESLDTCEEEFSAEVQMEINKAINRALDALIKPPTKFLFLPLNRMRDYYVSQGESSTTSSGNRNITGPLPLLRSDLSLAEQTASTDRLKIGYEYTLSSQHPVNLLEMVSSDSFSNIHDHARGHRNLRNAFH